MLAGTPWRCGKGQGVRVSVVPWSVITRQRPDPPGFGLSPASIENRGGRFAHEQLLGGPGLGQQRVMDWATFIRIPSDQSGTR